MDTQDPALSPCPSSPGSTQSAVSPTREALRDQDDKPRFSCTASECSLLGRVLGRREGEAGDSVGVGASAGADADSRSDQ